MLLAFFGMPHRGSSEIQARHIVDQGIGAHPYLGYPLFQCATLLYVYAMETLIRAVVNEISRRIRRRQRLRAARIVCKRHGEHGDWPPAAAGRGACAKRGHCRRIVRLMLAAMAWPAAADLASSPCRRPPPLYISAKWARAILASSPSVSIMRVVARYYSTQRQSSSAGDIIAIEPSAAMAGVASAPSTSPHVTPLENVGVVASRVRAALGVNVSAQRRPSMKIFNHRVGMASSWASSRSWHEMASIGIACRDIIAPQEALRALSCAFISSSCASKSIEKLRVQNRENVSLCLCGIKGVIFLGIALHIILHRTLFLRA